MKTFLSTLAVIATGIQAQEMINVPYLMEQYSLPMVQLPIVQLPQSYLQQQASLQELQYKVPHLQELQYKVPHLQELQYKVPHLQELQYKVPHLQELYVKLWPFSYMNLASIPSESAKGKALANKASAIANSRDTIGKCYAAVADAVDATVAVFLSGNDAYMSADQFASRSDFTEIKGLSSSDLPKLPAGAIVVWGKTGASPSGHIAISLGNGQEASDHIEAMHTSLRGATNFRVFNPK
jgi:hypothetical protein